MEETKDDLVELSGDELVSQALVTNDVGERCIVLRSRKNKKYQ